MGKQNLRIYCRYLDWRGSGETHSRFELQSPFLAYKSLAHFYLSCYVGDS